MCASPNPVSNYYYKFITEPDDALKCLICLKVAQDPKQHEKCGRLFCVECLEKHGLHKPCPTCRTHHPRYFDDNRSKREIKALRVKCDNAEKDCQWKGTVGKLEEHVGVCQFTLVPCPNECRDDNGILKIMRKDLEEHSTKNCPNRDYKCKYCGVKATYVNITQVHDHICEKKILPCMNEECTVKVKRMDMKNHIEHECKYTIISCQYASIGCDVKLKRKDMRAHEQDDKAHLKTAINTVVTSQKAIAILEDTVNKQKMYIVREINVMNYSAKRLEASTYHKLVELSHTVFKSKDTVSELQDAMVRLECYLKSLKRGESMTFKLTDYKEKKKRNLECVSPSFYTSPNGYHMSIIVYANGNGDGKGTHVSVFVNMLEGENDDEITWPFTGTVTITLLNQLRDADHYTRKLSFNSTVNVLVGSSNGLPLFIPHHQFPEHMIHDTLYFRVSVNDSNNKPWLESTADII